MTTGDKIRQKRIEKGLTQKELAAILGTTFQAIGKYEKGIVENIPMYKVRQIAKALDTTPAYLMGFDEKAPPTEREALIQTISDKISQLTPDQMRQVLRYAAFLQSSKEDQ